MDILFITLLTVVASAVGATSGFGISTIMIPILAMALPPHEAIFLVSIIHWFGNVWNLALYRTGFDKRLVALFGVPGVAMAFAGAYLAVGVDAELLLRTLGGVLTGYSALLLWKPGFRVRPLTRNAVIGGAASGFFAGLVGLGGILRGLALSAFDLPTSAYLATAAAIGLFVDSARVIAYVTGGAELSTHYWWGLLAFLPASLLSAVLAKRSVAKLSHGAYRTVLTVCFLLIGLKLLLAP
jgi:uncharacterized membrane protein YfcA